jgi:hypothetical protein
VEMDEPIGLEGLVNQTLYSVPIDSS